MSRGRKPFSYKVLNNWEDIFWNSLPTYIGILNNYFENCNSELVEIGSSLQKLSFNIPRGLNSKEIKTTGTFPVISQSKEFIIGYSDREDLLVKNDLPLIVFGDHSKTLKYVDTPFIIGADGVKLIKPKKSFNERFFYYFLNGIITDTKDYGRHFSLLRKGILPQVKSIELQKSVVKFLDDLKLNCVSTGVQYFNKEIENKIITLQKKQITVSSISTELTHQQDLLKQLRQSFLREAMQGKLVKQEKKDGNAKELLQKIKAEKEKLITEKKLKKEKSLPQTTAVEIPFTIPENWIWCRLGNICINVTDGEHVTPQKRTSGRMLLSAKNIRDGYITFDAIDYISEEDFQKSIKRCKPEIDDILIVSVGGTIGRSTIMKEDKEFAIVRSVALIKPFKKEMAKYLKYVLDSPILQKEISGRSWGTAQPCLYINQIKELIIPLPPLAEQKRIVKKLEEVMNLCDELKTTITDNETYTNQLLQVALKDALKDKYETKVISLPELQPIEDKHFLKRKVLATYIINQSLNDTKFGDVKFEKLLHLSDYFAIKRNLGQAYYQQTAGPYDNAFTNAYFTQIEKAKWFNRQKDGQQFVFSVGQQHNKSINTYNLFTNDELQRVNTLINYFKKCDYEQPEIISTLYAVWNNRIIRQQEINDDVLLQDFYEWDKQKEKYESSRLLVALKWMRDKNFIPDGWGKLIEKAKKKK